MMTTPAADSMPGASHDAGSIPWVHDRVRQWILTGRLKPGAVISQVRLSQELGVSRTPLREALRLLERERLVDAEHNRRVRVAELSLDDLDQIYASRIALECLAMRVTVPGLTDDVIATMDDQLAQMARAAQGQDYTTWEVPHSAFHELPILAAGDRFVHQLRQLSDHASRYRWISTTQSPHGWEDSTEDHDRIQRACAARDIDEAVRALAHHRGRVAVSSIGRLDPSFEPRLVRQALEMVRT